MSGNIEYFLCFDAVIGYIKGKPHVRKGKQQISHYGRRDKKFCLELARGLCNTYGEGSHWIEDEDGEKFMIETEIENDRPC